MSKLMHMQHNLHVYRWKLRMYMVYRDRYYLVEAFRHTQELEGYMYTNASPNTYDHDI